MGLDSLAGAGAAFGSLLSIGRGSGWLADMEGSWLSVGLDRRGGLGLQREGMYRAADLAPEDLIDEAVLLDPAATLKRRGCNRRTEMVAAAGVVVHLGVRPGDGGLNALLYVLGGRHRP
jgi:hypothetical protein